MVRIFISFDRSVALFYKNKEFHLTRFKEVLFISPQLKKIKQLSELKAQWQVVEVIGLPHREMPTVAFLWDIEPCAHCRLTSVA